MSLRRTGTRSVSPVGAAVTIIGALAVVQYFWWQGLIAKKPGVPPGPMRGGPAFVQGIPTVQGIPDALVETISGDPDPGFADGPGRSARFDGPCGLARSKDGTMYVADSRNNRIRQIETSGRTTTLCGSEEGFKDGPAATAQFSYPSGVAMGPDGTIFIADTENHRIRSVKAGQVTTVAGSVAGMVEGSGPTARFKLPTALAWTPAGGGALLVADSGNKRIRRIKWVSGSAMVDTLVVTPGMPTGLAVKGDVVAIVMPDAGLLVTGSAVSAGLGMSPTDGADPVDTSAFRVRKPFSIAAMDSGWLMSASDHACLLVFDSKVAHVIAGASQAKDILPGFRDGPGHKAALGLINGVIDDGQGHYWFTDTSNNAVRRVTLHGVFESGDEPSAPRKRGSR